MRSHKKHFNPAEALGLFFVTAHSSDSLRSFFRKNSTATPFLTSLLALTIKRASKDYFSPEVVPYTAIYRRNGTLSKAFERCPHRKAANRQSPGQLNLLTNLSGRYGQGGYIPAIILLRYNRRGYTFQLTFCFLN